MQWKTQKHSYYNTDSVIIFQKWVLTFCLHLDVTGSHFFLNIWNKKRGATLLVFAQSFTKGPISASDTSFRERTGASFTRTNRPLLFHSIRNLFPPFQLTNTAKPASSVVEYTAGCRSDMRNRGAQCKTRELPSNIFLLLQPTRTALIATSPTSPPAVSSRSIRMTCRDLTFSAIKQKQEGVGLSSRKDSTAPSTSTETGPTTNKASVIWAASSGSGWTRFTDSQVRPTTHCELSWRTFKGTRLTQSTTRLLWQTKQTTTRWAWETTQVTKCGQVW